MVEMVSSKWPVNWHFMLHEKNLHSETAPKMSPIKSFDICLFCCIGWEVVTLVSWFRQADLTIKWKCVSLSQCGSETTTKALRCKSNIGFKGHYRVTVTRRDMIASVTRRALSNTRCNQRRPDKARFYKVPCIWKGHSSDKRQEEVSYCPKSLHYSIQRGYLAFAYGFAASCIASLASMNDTLKIPELYFYQVSNSYFKATKRECLLV